MSAERSTGSPAARGASEAPDGVETVDRSAPGLTDAVDPLIGTTGADPTEYGGMVPSTAPPFAMTRWTPMTRLNDISRCPYHHDDGELLGVVGSHQPAIWMGDWGQALVSVGVGEVPGWVRPLALDKSTEVARAHRYSVEVLDAGARIGLDVTGTDRVGVIGVRFPPDSVRPHVVLRATRPGIEGEAVVDGLGLTGRNPERQDAHLGPPQAASFAGFVVARIDVRGADGVLRRAEPAEIGTALDGVVHPGAAEAAGSGAASWMVLPDGTREVLIRCAVSLISYEQAWATLQAEAPDGVGVEAVSTRLRQAWETEIDRVTVDGADDGERTTLATALFHALQYPARVDEVDGARWRRYDGYLDQVVEVERPAYTAFSLWDTFRAQHALLILLDPARAADIVASLLAGYRSSGWLPVWENLVETNIMVGTHADSILAESVLKGVDVDVPLAFEAAFTNATVPPPGDTEHWWGDRGPERLVTARAGLTRYADLGWVAADETAEAGSRTLDYAFDDHAVAVLADAAGHAEHAAWLRERSRSYRNLWNAKTGFMQARDASGAWVDGAWTEGTRWPYTFGVLHDVPGLIELMGRELFLQRLEEHFAGGWNRHDNEPSHHIPYLFSCAGQPWRTAEVVRQIARESYLPTPDGLCGNDDLGQMSAWYVFTALGFYPVNPASTEYVVGSPLFDRLEIALPHASRPLRVLAPGAPQLPYVAALRIDARVVTDPVIDHTWIADGADVVFTMSATPTAWGTPSGSGETLSGLPT